MTTIALDRGRLIIATSASLRETFGIAPAGKPPARRGVIAVRASTRLRPCSTEPGSLRRIASAIAVAFRRRSATR